MRLFAVDTDVLSPIANAGENVALRALGRAPVILTDVVWQECSGGDGRLSAERLALATAWCGGPTVIQPGSPEAGTAATLLAQGDLEVGEISILSWAAHHADVVPVLYERHALLRALEEMPLRPVLSIHGFLAELVLLGLPRSAAKTISRSYCAGAHWKKGVRPQPPLWW